MFFARLVVPVAAVLLLLSGCASLDQIQAAMSEVDQFWEKTNRETLARSGSKLVPAPVDRTAAAVRATATSLGFAEVPSAGPTNLKFKARSPAPFSEAEYKAIRVVEEPIMQAMAATHVGHASSFFVLSSSDTNTLLDISLAPQGDSTRVAVDFELEWIKGRKQSGLLLGTQPPPEAVRRGLEKFWTSLDKTVRDR